MTTPNEIMDECIRAKRIETAISIFENELVFLRNNFIGNNDYCSDVEVEERISDLNQAIEKGKEALK